MNPHFRYNIDHANKGDNALATAAYQHRTQLHDETEPDPNKRYKSSNTHTEDIKRERIMIPANNPTELYERAEKAKTDKKENDRLIEYLLNKLKRKRANRYTVHGILTHQPELTDEQNYEAVELFGKRLATDYNCLYLYATHTEKHGNRNIHSHYIASLFPLIDGEFTPKTTRIYVDANGEILTKTDTPILKRGQLQYTNAEKTTYKTRKGWQTLDLDENGKIQYDEKGRIKLKDIRIPLVDNDGNRIYYKNGTRQKPDWVHIKQKNTEMEKRGTTKRTRLMWQDCINEIARKYHVKDANGKLFQVDLRSLAEQDADKPISQKRIPRKKIGPYKNQNAIEYNAWVDRIERNEKINEKIPFDDLQQIYEIRREAIILENRLVELQEQKKISYKAKKVFTDLTEKTSNLFGRFTKKVTEEKQTKTEKSYKNQMEFWERSNNVEYYLEHPNALKYKAEDRAKKANQIIQNDNVWGIRTKEKYFEISDTSKSFKELLIIKMLKRLPKEQNFEFIDGLRSKEFESLALKLNLKKDFKNYKMWLTASQNYYSHLPESEKKRQIRHSSKTFISSAASSFEKSYSSSLPSYNNIVPDKSNSRSILPDTKTPDLKLKWKEKDYKKENEMEAAERRLSENWDPGKNLEVLPPDQKKDQDQKHEF
ncbi:MAG: MobA/MobL family protein [Acidaminococcaceae bacterium]|nr:MobA/MobL family protein [Acidaminococcaceae bacterium]